jgi:transposase
MPWPSLVSPWQGSRKSARFPDEATRFLNDLVCRRRQIIIEMIVAEKRRAMRLSNKRPLQSIARLVKALEKELASFDADIDATVRGSPAWREKEDLLISVPGVGKCTARTLLAVVPELGTLGAREAESIVACAPFTRQSGLWKGKSFIGRGRPAARSAFFLSALVAVRHNPQMKSFYERPVGAGKAKMVALIAVARKLAVLLDAIFQDKRPWRFPSKRGLAHAEASI